MYSPFKTGRLKNRLRNSDRRKVYFHAEKEAMTNMLPELKQFLNTLPILDRVRVAWRIILGRF